MTLDEAIKQCHQIIHNKTVEAETLKDGYEVFAKDCLDSVEVHKQLAECLQELKELRENKGKIIEAVYNELIPYLDVGLTEGYELVEDALGDLPSAAPEIIRCRDCKHHRYDSDDITPYCIIDCGGYGWKNDDFCSYAERKVR